MKELILRLRIVLSSIYRPTSSPMRNKKIATTDVRNETAQIKALHRRQFNGEIFCLKFHRNDFSVFASFLI